MSTVKKPILGITMGDPFGNGPEITVRALADETVYDRCRPLVVGDAASMEYAAAVYNCLLPASVRGREMDGATAYLARRGAQRAEPLTLSRSERRGMGDVHCTARPHGG